MICCWEAGLILSKRMEISNKIQQASKWSLVTEIVSKLTSPITNMVLARLLVPEAFGMVATVTMITSLADLLANAGFQKYLVQCDHEGEEYDRRTNVAFWANLSVSALLWIVIALFRNPIAAAAGNGGLGTALAVASLSLPLTALSSTQMARFRRDLDFKTLFYAKLLGICIPLIVTIPLAFVLRSFWALILGNLAVSVSNAVLLTLRSKWKPSFYFCFSRLCEMLGFSLWTFLEQFLGWANLNIGIFVVGVFLSDYYLGLYKTSMASVNQIMSILVNAVSPVLLSSLSRLKDDDREYKAVFYQFEETISMVIFPLGIGIFVFRDLYTQILLGSQWGEAASFVGLWSLVRAVWVVFGMFSMEVLVSKGKPRLSALTQALVLAALLPVLFITAKTGYETLYIARSLVVIWSIVIEMATMYAAVRISPLEILRRAAPYLLAAICMGVVGELLLGISRGIVWQFTSVLICMVVYFALICLYPRSRKNFVGTLRTALKKSEQGEADVDQ